MDDRQNRLPDTIIVSVLFNEPKLLKCRCHNIRRVRSAVSVLFNEPKLLKFSVLMRFHANRASFSALQRAEIAEMLQERDRAFTPGRVSVLFNEPKLLKSPSIGLMYAHPSCFSALQRAEIAEISLRRSASAARRRVSVLFNEPKLLKSNGTLRSGRAPAGVSVLFNEPKLLKSSCSTLRTKTTDRFQCSSTSRNC